MRRARERVTRPRVEASARARTRARARARVRDAGMAPECPTP